MMPVSSVVAAASRDLHSESGGDDSNLMAKTDYTNTVAALARAII
jgi:hypothetical protein